MPIFKKFFLYYAADRWLSSFAYKISIEPLVFLLSATVAFLVATAAVTLITYRSALENPVNSLKEDQ